MDRRDFLSHLGSPAAASGIALAAGAEASETSASSAAPLPTIALGEHRVTRLIVGMYPEFFDEIMANAGYMREFGQPRTRT